MYNKGDLAMKKTCNIIKKFGGGGNSEIGLYIGRSGNCNACNCGCCRCKYKNYKSKIR